MKNRFFRLWFYFRYGYSTILAFFVGLANFVAIQYRNIVERINFLEALFPSLLIFIVGFIVTVVPLAILLGYLSFVKVGPYPIEMTVATKANPWFQDMAKAIIAICPEDKREEVKELLEKWT